MISGTVQAGTPQSKSSAVSSDKGLPVARCVQTPLEQSSHGFSAESFAWPSISRHNILTREPSALLSFVCSFTTLPNSTTPSNLSGKDKTGQIDLAHACWLRTSMFQPGLSESTSHFSSKELTCSPLPFSSILYMLNFPLPPQNTSIIEPPTLCHI